MWHLTRLLTMTGLWSVSLWSISLLLVGAALGDDPKCLQVGDSIPEFQCLDDQGKMLDSREYVGKQMLVIFFYPSDFAFCCTRQAQRYRDCQKELADLGDCRKMDDDHRQRRPHPQSTNRRLTRKRQSRSFEICPQVGGQIVIT